MRAAPRVLRLDLSDEDRAGVARQRGSVSSHSRPCSLINSSPSSEMTRAKPHEAKGLPSVAEFAVRRRTVDGGADRIAIADGDALVRHGGKLCRMVFPSQGVLQPGRLRPAPRKSVRGNSCPPGRQDQRRRAERPARSPPEPSRWWVCFEWTCSQNGHTALLPFTAFPSCVRATSVGCPVGRTVMDDRLELTRSPVRLDTEALSRDRLSPARDVAGRAIRSTGSGCRTPGREG